MDSSPPGPSDLGALQAGILEWVAMPFSRGSSPPGDCSHASCAGRQILYHRATSHFSSVLSHVWLLATLWTAARHGQSTDPENAASHHVAIIGDGGCTRLYPAVIYARDNCNWFSINQKIKSLERVMKWEEKITNKRSAIFKIYLYLFCFSEKAMAHHSSTLAWKIPWTDEPGRVQSMGSWRVGHNWATSLSLFTFMH